MIRFIYYPEFKNILEHSSASILLSYLVSLAIKNKYNEAPALIKSDLEITKETGLTSYQLRTSKKLLKNYSFCYIKTRGLPSTTNYIIDLDLLNDELLLNGFARLTN